MTQPALVDVNVVLPLLMPQHEAHAAAMAWLSGHSAGTVHFAWPTQLGVLRLLSQPRVMGPSALGPDRALQTWNDLVSAIGMQEIVSLPPEHAQYLSRLVAGRAATPNLWTDAWLAALALALDYEMVSFDKGFRSFRGVSLRLLKA